MNKSILVGDIGSTKSTWLYNTDTLHEIQLDGFNPMVHSASSGKNLVKSLFAVIGDNQIASIWYYGAGVINEETSNQVRGLLAELFPKSQIHIASDLKGAALAACGDNAGTVAILGTGSHAAIYDGQQIVRQAVSLGYILGDEGGGCDIGKALLQAYFYHEMPDDLIPEMAKRLPGGRAGMLSELQSSAAPNQYLADFARLAVLFKDHLWVQELICSRFKLFVKRHLLPLHPEGQVHIVGSIGCIFAGLIQQEIESNGLDAGQFIKDPARRLFEMHLEHEHK